MEEGVAGQHPGPLDQPVVEGDLLLGGGMQPAPGVGAAARRAQPGQPQLGAVAAARCSRASSWPALWRVTTTLILNGPNPASARWSIARRAAAYEPSPRTASLVAASAPSIEICTST